MNYKIFLALDVQMLHAQGFAGKTAFLVVVCDVKKSEYHVYCVV